MIVDGDHNTPRPQFLLDSSAIFLQNTLCASASFDPPNRDIQASTLQDSFGFAGFFFGMHNLCREIYK